MCFHYHLKLKILWTSVIQDQSADKQKLWKWIACPNLKIDVRLEISISQHFRKSAQSCFECFRLKTPEYKPIRVRRQLNQKFQRQQLHSFWKFPAAHKRLGTFAFPSETSFVAASFPKLLKTTKILKLCHWIYFITQNQIPLLTPLKSVAHQLETPWFSGFFLLTTLHYFHDAYSIVAFASTNSDHLWGRPMVGFLMSPIFVESK